MTQNLPQTKTLINTNQEDISVSNLAPNNYLTIVWKDSSGKQINTLDIDDEKALTYTMELSNAIESSISNNNVSYVGQNKYINFETIGKYIAQNAISDGTQRRVVNALIGLASGDPKNIPSSTANLCLNVFGTVTDKVARSLGLSDPIQIFSQVTGQNVMSIFSELGNKTADFLEDKLTKLINTKKTNVISKTDENKKGYVGLLLGLTTSDTENYEITIPRRKVEEGSDYTTHLLPQPFKKDFSVVLTNKVLSPDFSRINEINSIEDTKEKLIEIANSRIPFDIYIRLSDEKMYKKSNVFFSSLSFDKSPEVGNSYTCTFSIEPIGNFKTKTFVSTKNYSKNKGGGSSSKSNGKNTKTGNPIEVFYHQTEKKVKFNNEKELIQHVKREKDVYLMQILDKTTGRINYDLIRAENITTLGGGLARKSDVADYNKVARIMDYKAINVFSYIDPKTNKGTDLTPIRSDNGNITGWRSEKGNYEYIISRPDEIKEGNYASNLL